MTRVSSLRFALVGCFLTALVLSATGCEERGNNKINTIAEETASADLTQIKASSKEAEGVVAIAYRAILDLNGNDFSNTLSGEAAAQYGSTIALNRLYELLTDYSKVEIGHKTVQDNVSPTMTSFDLVGISSETKSATILKMTVSCYVEEGPTNVSEGMTVDRLCKISQIVEY